MLLLQHLKRHEALSRIHETHLSTRVKLDSVGQQELPPAPLVIALIKIAKARPSVSLVAFSYKGVAQLEALCQKVYFPLEPPSAGSMTFFYGFLYFVVRDYWSQQDPALREYDAQAIIDLCETRFCAGLESFETLTVPVLPNIQALLIGAIKAQEECKLSLSWTFLSAAATMCHTLGFHRKSSLAHEDQESADIKRHLFWQLYMLDKNLSLNLGRGSNFPDADIDAEFYTPSTNPAQRPWDLMSLATILFAKLQGQVYDKLYSASAMSSSLEERSRVVDELSSQVNSLRNQLLSIDFTGAHYQERLIGMAQAADFVCYSVLTVIYRAQPLTSSTTEISPQCYEAARLGLENHLRCFAQFRNRSVPQQAEYVNWILLYPSFTPFTVVFIHAIATSNTEELQLLQETVHSLDHVKFLSPAAKRLHDVCAAFAKVAAAFITSQRTLSNWHCRGDGTLSLASAETADYAADLAAVGQDQDAL
ncbi:putative C6 transcription factor, partial [Aureobasidium melanogenum]